MAKIKVLLTTNVVDLPNEAQYAEFCSYLMENIEGIKTRIDSKYAVDTTMDECLLDETYISRNKCLGLETKVIDLTVDKAPISSFELEKLLPNFEEFSGKKIIDVRRLNDGYEVFVTSQKYHDELEILKQRIEEQHTAFKM